jgi:hypothetical protein
MVDHLVIRIQRSLLPAPTFRERRHRGLAAFPASVIRTVATSIALPPATMRSAIAVARPAPPRSAAKSFSTQSG